MKIKNKKLIVNLVFSLLLYSLHAKAEYVEFNRNGLSISDKTHLDLSSFENNLSGEGSYFSNVSVNGKRINFFDKIDFLKREIGVQPCISQNLIKIIGLKEEFIKEIPTWHNGQCYDFSSQDKNIQARFDDENQELVLSIPQAYFLYTDDNWVPPTQRDIGINALLFDYNIIKDYIKYKQSKNSNTMNSYGSVGANIGRWRIRSNYQFNKDFSHGENDKFNWVQTYLFTDLPSQSAKFFVGKHYTASQLFDSVRFIGLSVFTDEKMLPASLRGYAPSVTGTATSNATVVVSQNGRVLSQVKVAPGPFSIDNLSSSLSGTLDVKITEEDGSVSEYQIASTSIPFLTRPGMTQYKFNAGRLAPLGTNEVNNSFISAEISRGILNNLSLFGGFFATSDGKYQAYDGGIGVNMDRFGALSIDAMQSRNSLIESTLHRGESYRLNYAKRFSETTRLDLTGYQFSNEGFMSVSDFINTRNNLQSSYLRQKNVFTTSLTQQIPDWNLDLTLRYSQESYWNESKNRNTLNLSLNKTLNNALLSLSLSESRDTKGKQFKQAYLSLSVPFGENTKSRIQYFASYNDVNNKYRQNVNYYTNTNGNNLSLGVASNNFSQDVGINASLYRDTQYGQIQASSSISDDYYSMSGSIDGSFTLTGKGPVLQRRVYQNQARMVIDADNVKDISLNQDEAVTNRFGLAGISNVPTYYRATQYVDMNKLPENVSIENNVIDTTLTDGAVGYAKLSSIVGDKAMLSILLSDGQYPPFGALVYDAKNQDVLGMIAENGQVYLAGLQPEKKLIVKWNGNNECYIKLEKQVIQHLEQLICYNE